MSYLTIVPPTQEMIPRVRPTITVPMSIATAILPGETAGALQQVSWMLTTTTMTRTMIHMVQTTKASKGRPIRPGERKRAKGSFVRATPLATSALPEVSIWLVTSGNILARDPSSAIATADSPDWTTCANMHKRCMLMRRSPPTHSLLQALDFSVRYEPIAFAPLVAHGQELQGVLVATVVDIVETFQHPVSAQPLPIIVL